jgi:hypothetical protein
MNIRIFMASATSLLEKSILRAFGQGVQSWIDKNSSTVESRLNHTRIGRWSNFEQKPLHTLEYDYQENYRACDIAVIFGSWKPREKGSHNTRNSVASNANRFFVIETPLLQRQTARENTAWRVGINGYLNRDAEWPLLSKDVASKKLKDLGIKWAGWHVNDDGHILLALQLPGDASLRGADINEWALRSVQEIRRHTDRPITIRNHPLASDRAFVEHRELAAEIMYKAIPNVKFSDGAVVPWSTDLDGAWCTVTYTSGLAIDSVLAGIPTVACDEGNFAWGVSSNMLEEINAPRLASYQEINTWLHYLVGCQWSLDEMRQGVAWQYLYQQVLGESP